MELKKSSKANLEKRRQIFLQIGLVLSLAVVFMAFQKGTEIQPFGELNDNTSGVVPEEFYTPPTNLPKPPPPPPKPKLADELLITDVDIDIEGPEIESSEIDGTTLIDALPAVMPENKIPEKEEIFRVVEKMPEFPGGDKALVYWIANSIKYPVPAIDLGIDGTVYVEFVVDKTGLVINERIYRGVDQYLDKEALRVIGSMPKWKPGLQRGKPVKVMFVVPIKFQLKQSI